MGERDRSVSSPRRRSGARLWEAVVLAAVVGAAAYFAGLRAGAERVRRGVPGHVEASASPHGMTMPSSGEGEAKSAPRMSLAEMKANLSKVTDVDELVGIANQHLDNARSMEEQGQTDGLATLYTIAVAAYERSLELKPRDPNLTTDLGIAYRGLRDANKALALFREAAKADPRHPQSRFNIGLVLRDDLSRPAEARQAWEDYLRVAPKDDPNRKWVESELPKLR